MSYRYAIKSKDRVNGLHEKTYKFLKKYGATDQDIDIFVSTDKNFAEYSMFFPKCKVIKGPLGIANIDNFIVDYYDEGQRYIYLNDDIKDLYIAHDTKTLKTFRDTWEGPCRYEFHTWICDTFKDMDKHNISYGGLYPVMNPFFMRNSQDKYKTDMCLIMDPFSFVINNKKIKLNNFYLDEDFNENMYSDFEKSILHFEDKGALLRLNHYCLDVEYFNGKDTSNRTQDRAELAAQSMVDAYPDYIRGIKYLRNGFCSLRFNRIKNRDIMIC